MLGTFRAEGGQHHMYALSARFLAVVSPLLAAGAVAACASAPAPGGASPAPATSPVAVSDGRAASTPIAAPSATEAPVGASVCWTRGRPRPVVVVKHDTPLCRAIDGAELARVETAIRRDFVIFQKPSKVVVDFGCDGAYGPLKEVIYEDGSGHGGSLRLVRFDRGGGTTVPVRMIASQHYTNAGVVVRAAQVPLRELDALVGRSRVAMVARPHAIVLTPTGTEGLGISGTSSSNDFHLRLRLVDGTARTTDRSFTGYDSSDAQEAVLPMRLATDPFEKLLATLSFTTEAMGDEDRAFFKERFLETTADGEHPGWWVKERFVALAAQLGTLDIVPRLVAIAKQKGQGASGDRTRELAVTAIAAITGWDARKDPRGQTRTIDQAVDAIAAECTTP